MQFFYRQFLGYNQEPGHMVDFAIFSESPYVQNPTPLINNAIQGLINQPQIQDAVYYEFVEEWLDDPWLRLIIRGINTLHYNPLPNNNAVGHYAEQWNNPFTGVFSELHILYIPPQTPNPKQVLDDAVMDVVQGRSYNGFVDSSLRNPYVRVVIVGLNNIAWVR